VQDLFTNKEEIWMYWETYFPHTITGTGWFSMFDAHAVGIGGSPRLDTNPGLFFQDDLSSGDPTNGFLQGDMLVLFYWQRLAQPRFSPTSSVPIPVGQWAEIELMYKRSDDLTANGAMQLWIDNVLAIDEQNVVTWEDDHVRFEFYHKFYGAPGDTNWVPQQPRMYWRNAQVADGKLSDGNPGDSEPPNNEGLGKNYAVTRTNCMAPCAVQFDVQKTEALTWDEVKDTDWVWDFDDGGATSDGFLAVHVYETPGVYNAVVTENGTPWQTTAVTVTAPGTSRCVSLVSDFDDCPSAEGADHYTSVSAGMAAITSDSELLFHRGESYGAQNLQSSVPDAAIGAYGSGAKPTFIKTSSSDWDTEDERSYFDLEIDDQGSSSYAFGAGAANVLLLRLDIPTCESLVIKSSAFGVNAGLYVIGCDVTCDDGYIGYTGGTEINWVGNTLARINTSSDHNVRIAGGRRVLFQNNIVTATDGHTGLAFRGSGTRPNPEWALIQGNYFNVSSHAQPQNDTSNELVRWVIWERNLHDHSEDIGSDLGAASFIGHFMMIRNNLGWQSRRGLSAGSHPLVGDSQNIEFINNTCFDTQHSSSSIYCTRCGGSTIDCVTKNNLAQLDSSSAGNCFSTGGTGSVMSNNYCYSTVLSGICILPDDEATCTDPNWVNDTDMGHADFLRPAAGTPGIDAGDQTVPIWEDYWNAPRTTIDVGGVER
jgi:PKD repeat protein